MQQRERTPELKRAIATEPATRQLWEHAKLLEGLSRNAGVHAAGVVIAIAILSDYIPLCRDSKGNDVISQYAMGPLNDLGPAEDGFPRIENADRDRGYADADPQTRPRTFRSKTFRSNDPASLRALQPRRNHRPVPDGIRRHDQSLEAVRRQKARRHHRVDRAVPARPDGADPGLHESKKGLTKIKYLASAARGNLRRHLRRDDLPGAGDGCGEQTGRLLACARPIFSGAPWARRTRRRWRRSAANFIEGCARTNKIPEKKANAIFDLLEKFAGYGFNKSHSAAYGVISYQTAYLKANYPVEFMAGLLSNEINNTEKISVFVGECKRMGIPILPPDMNKSGLKFTPETVGGTSASRRVAAPRPLPH